jgi:hypothetical protein
MGRGESCLTALVAHYNGVTAPHEKYYEVWNEANLTCSWNSTIPSLVSMARAACLILKQGSVLLRFDTNCCLAWHQ